MHQEVYIDIVFAANLLMDYILLRLTGIVLRRKIRQTKDVWLAGSGRSSFCVSESLCTTRKNRGTDHSSSSSLCCVHDMDRI